MKPTVIITETAKQYAALINRGNTVFAGLTGNPNFLTPLPALTVLTSAITACANALAAWGDVHNRGSHADLVTLRSVAVTLYNTLRSLAAYVQNTAQTAAGTDYAAMTVLIESSGFDIKHAKTPTSVPEIVQNFREFISRRLNVNQREFRWKKPLSTKKGAKLTYKVLMAASNSISAATVITTVDQTRYTYTNAGTVVVTLTFWVMAHGAAGDGVTSPGITVTIPPAS